MEVTKPTHKSRRDPDGKIQEIKFPGFLGTPLVNSCPSGNVYPTTFWSVAKDEKIEKGRKARIDCTVVESNIHPPLDSVQLFDAVRVVTDKWRPFHARMSSKGDILDPQKYLIQRDSTWHFMCF